MEKYSLSGFYLYSRAPNGKGKLTGNLELSSDNSFETEITDHASRFPKQLIKGHLKKDKGLIRMVFLKFPPSQNLANLFYSLIKGNDGSFKGKYKGEWAALPFKVEYNSDYNLFVSKIDVSAMEFDDKTEIDLF